MEPHRERYTNKLPKAQALQIAKSTQSARWPWVQGIGKVYLEEARKRLDLYEQHKPCREP